MSALARMLKDQPDLPEMVSLCFISVISEDNFIKKQLVKRCVTWAPTIFFNQWIARFPGWNVALVLMTLSNITDLDKV